MDAVFTVFFRWLHLTTACVVVGGLFFIRIVIPIALRSLDADSARTMFLRARRVFKMVVHTCILLLLISGAYNAWGNWSKYAGMGKGLGHSLFGMHLLLALLVFGVALWLLAGAEPRKNHLRWAAINLALMFLTIAAGSVLKYARDAHSSQPANVVLVKSSKI